MKIRAERAPLADALTWVAQAIGKNPPAPVLAGVHLAAAGGELVIRAFDYDRSHAQTLAVDVASEGEALVSGHFLRAIVAAMKGTEVELALDGGTLTISCGRATYRTREMAVGDYPTLPTLPAMVGRVDAGELQAAVGAVKQPLDTNAMVAVFGGIRLEGGSEGLTLVGMDRSHVARAAVGWNHSADLAVTIPGRALEDAVKGMEGMVTIGQHEGVFGLSDATRVTAVSDGPVSITTSARGLWGFTVENHPNLSFAVMAKRRPGGTR